MPDTLFTVQGGLPPYRYECLATLAQVQSTREWYLLALWRVFGPGVDIPNLGFMEAIKRTARLNLEVDHATD